MIRVIIVSFLLLASGAVRAQNTIFLAQGRIEFERKINQYAQMEAMRGQGDDDAWAEFSKKVMGSKFKTDYFDLWFARGHTLYRPGRESTDKPSPFFVQTPAQDNVIAADLAGLRETAQKRVFEQTFLVQDSLRPIRWKITDERREIAGFSCRRANALIMDSVYVVAFYTDEILTPGGPESFSGLPGMILEVALPHEHITWIATKVEAVPVPDSELSAPAKGKKVTNAALLAVVQRSLTDWGRQGRMFLQAVML